MVLNKIKKTKKKSDQSENLVMSKGNLLVDTRFNKDGEIIYKLNPTSKVDSRLKPIMKILLSSSVRRHTKFYPCCKNYDEGADLTA